MSVSLHLQFLEQRMATMSCLPSRFEYYSAIHLTKLHNVCFYAYKDIPISHKRYAGFPLTDKGIDLIDETFSHIGQVKYYGPRSKIHYGKLSTFLATPILVGRKHLQMTLVRTHHSKLHSEIHQIVQRGDLKDVTLCAREFKQNMRG
jgi:hypothetical protein